MLKCSCHRVLYIISSNVQSRDLSTFDVSKLSPNISECTIVTIQNEVKGMVSPSEVATTVTLKQQLQLARSELTIITCKCLTQLFTCTLLSIDANQSLPLKV